MNQSEKNHVKRSDLRMYLQAVRNGWPIDQQQRTKIMSEAIEASLTGNERLKATADELLEAMRAAETLKSFVTQSMSMRSFENADRRS